MVDIEATSYVGFSPLRGFSMTHKHERSRRETETDVTYGSIGAMFGFTDRWPKLLVLARLYR